MQDKIQTLCEDWGYKDEMEAAEDLVLESVSPGICINEDCDYSTEVEPDCQDGYCEECGTQSVKSLLILMGIM